MNTALVCTVARSDALFPSSDRSYAVIFPLPFSEINSVSPSSAIPEGRLSPVSRIPHSIPVLRLYSAKGSSLEGSFMMSTVSIVVSSVLTHKIRLAPVSAMYKIPDSLSNIMCPGIPASRVN